MHLAERPHQIVSAEQFQQITGNYGVERAVAKRHSAGVYRLAVRPGPRNPAPGLALRPGGHIRGEVDAESHPARVAASEVTEHFAGTRGDLEYAHAVANTCK